MWQFVDWMRSGFNVWMRAPQKSNLAGERSMPRPTLLMSYCQQSVSKLSLGDNWQLIEWIRSARFVQTIAQRVFSNQNTLLPWKFRNGGGRFWFRNAPRRRPRLWVGIYLLCLLLFVMFTHLLIFALSSLYTSNHASVDTKALSIISMLRFPSFVFKPLWGDTLLSANSRYWNMNKLYLKRQCLLRIHRHLQLWVL